MVLESCMILLDNSEYMRNGDYIPTRLEAQHDAANLLVGTKTQSNPENTVGVIAMTGENFGTTNSSTSSSSSKRKAVGSNNAAELLISPTDDMGKILSALHGIPIRKNGGTDITAPIQVASLALKHRRNKNGAQRVICFVGSPLTCDTKALVKAGKQLKKNGVSIDVICMGELEENETKLKELVDAANGGSGGEELCHLVSIPAGVLPSDVLVSSPIIHGGAGGASSAGSAGAGGESGGAAAAAGGSGGGGFGDFGGVDPNMDPELAMALRVSMEEERARQERAAAASASESKEGEDAAAAGEVKDETMEEVADGATSSETKEDSTPAAAAAPAVAQDDEDALLQQALAMSMNEDRIASSDTAPDADTAAATGGAVDMDEDDAAMQLALQMSMAPEEAAQSTGQPDKPKEGEEGKGDDSQAQQFQDPQFVNQLLGSLPGVDPNDPAIQEALRNLQAGDAKKEGDDKDASKKEDK